MSSRLPNQADSRRLSARREPIAARPVKAGARVSKTKVSDKADAWLQHHKLTAIDSLLRLLCEPVKSCLTVLMLGISLALPALLYVALANVNQLSGQWASSNQLSIYLQPGATQAAAQSLAEKIELVTEVAQVSVISPSQGLSEFAAQSGMGSLLNDLTDNPLPWVLLVQPHQGVLEAERLQQLRSSWAADPVVSDVRIDMAWLERLNYVMQLGQRFALGLGLLLGIGMLLAIGNTLRLAIENRREEILVIKLVGGTDGFVRRPFLYTGLWYGLGGGLCALILVVLGLFSVATPVANLAQSYSSQFTLQGLGVGNGLILLAMALLIGLLGAWLAVGRHLRDIRPQ
ncbi:permease-like cell division protein FtsX [Simiduia curdlanivorans]|uniref:Cell division protein FtsX n=1 Tax=Simiduia curdlanivorans TaxID=1492769 RepID=A0ABV8V2R5_9GAMM|nr:permease-like cell division protein FtsX [Simiduia curdlanivorans]MDN3637909.1 permease-like cell division protein FtsX [Simiduia curdlanivorans]